MKIIGHRGVRGSAPENTLAAIDEALSQGADEIEVDIRETGDGVLVLHHDAFICSADSRQVAIAAKPYQELRTIKTDICSLSDAIDHLARRVPLIIELKDGVTVERLVGVIKAYRSKGWRQSDLQVASFDYTQLGILHRLLPDVPLVVNERWSAIRATRRARRLGTKRLSLKRQFLWRGVLWSLKRRGYRVSPYTVNDPALVRTWRHYLYGVITDQPGIFTGKVQ